MVVIMQSCSNSYIWHMRLYWILLVGIMLLGCTSAPQKKPISIAQSTSELSDKARSEQQQAILKIRDQTLSQLKKSRPQTKIELERAAGYGVFEVNGLNALLAASHGRGVVVDKNSGKELYMGLARGDLRPGATMKPYRQVLIFRNPQKLQQLINAGTPADLTRDPDIKVYRLDEKGVKHQADWGARYFRDADLNWTMPNPGQVR